jgi:mono/diheme cytochrome c family protein
MQSSYIKFATWILILGLLSACGAQPTTLPTTSPTETALPPTTAPTDLPPSTDTAAPTESAPATEPPAATQPAEQISQGATVSFANDILPLLQSRCVNCHGGNRTEEGLVLRSHSDVLAGSDNGLVVIPGEAANSLLVEMVATLEMPDRGPKLTPPQIQLITDWVNQGALNN